MLSVQGFVEPDILIFVARPGELVHGADGWRREGRTLRYEVGRETAPDLAGLAHLLEPYDRTTRAILDPRKGVVVQETIAALECLRRLGFEEVHFAGTQEND